MSLRRTAEKKRHCSVRHLSHLFNERENGKKAKAAPDSDCKGSAVIHQGRERKRLFKMLKKMNSVVTAYLI